MAVGNHLVLHDPYFASHDVLDTFVTQTPDGPRNEVFKVRRYVADYPGLVELEIPGPSTD